MASSSKPTAVHFSLVFFVLLSLVLGLLYWAEHRQLTDRVAEFDKAKKDAQDATRASGKALEQIDALKKLVGHGFEKVGEDDPTNPNTVLGAMNQDIRNLGQDVAQENYSATLKKLAEALRTMTTERDDLRSKLDAEHAAYLALEAKWSAQLAQEKDARDKSEQDLAGLTKTKEEQLAAKDKDIGELTQTVNDVRAEAGAARDSYLKEKKDLETRISNLTNTNSKLQDEVRNLTRVSFEIPDGVIRWVDFQNKTVWINLGEVDNLHERTTFSVYNRTNSGVARGAQDIKGAIEVTRILGPHLSEARIRDDDIYNPMAAGDPVYTPLWSPGRAQDFAIVGLIDLDGDKRSDRDLLHEIIKTAGARISLEIDDDGQLHGDPISERTKFLVIGELPNVIDAALPEDKEKIAAIAKHYKDLSTAAREHGVTIVSLSDFLNYIGFKTQRRLFKPGSEAGYNLKAGSRGASVEKAYNHPSGKTSGAYSGNKNLRPKSSTGTTSKLFRGGK